MQLGIFTKTFVRPTLEGTLDAIHQGGLKAVQFNMESAGQPTMPARIEANLCDRIRQEMAARHLAMAAVSGTFNMIHPDLQERQEGMQRLRVLAAACAPLGTSLITLCTGTCDPGYMWRQHPENDSPEAWTDLIASMTEAALIAQDHNLTLAFEPEVSNVVDSALKARRLLDEIQSPHLKVVFDGANLYHAGELPRMREILDQAFDLLGPDIVLAHAKDLERDGEAGNMAAGTGVLDYDHYLSRLRAVGFDGALILHSLEEDQVEASVAFLREKLVY